MPNGAGLSDAAMLTAAGNGSYHERQERKRAAAFACRAQLTSALLEEGPTVGSGTWLARRALFLLLRIKRTLFSLFFVCPTFSRMASIFQGQRMTKTNLNVVKLPCGNVGDIPAALRRLSELIESGADSDSAGFRGGVKAFAWVSLDSFGDVAIGGLGHNLDRHKTAGILQHGSMELLARCNHE